MESEASSPGAGKRRLSIFRKLHIWHKHHLAPAALWYLACTLSGTGLVMGAWLGAYFHVAGRHLAHAALAGIGLLAAPFVIASATALLVPATPASSYWGFFNSYHLTESRLVYKLCRVIPVFYVPLAEIRFIQPWRGVGPAAFASKENNLYWFLFLNIWFWPVSVRQMLKILFSLPAIRCEYALTCDSGWIIVVACSDEFAARIHPQVKGLDPQRPDRISSGNNR